MYRCTENDQHQKYIAFSQAMQDNLNYLVRRTDKDISFYFFLIISRIPNGVFKCDRAQSWFGMVQGFLSRTQFSEKFGHSSNCVFDKKSFQTKIARIKFSFVKKL